MATGQCMGCGRLYEQTKIHEGAVDNSGNIPLPESQQPAGAGGYATPGHHEPNLGSKYSTGYCKDCSQRDIIQMQWRGTEKGAQKLGKTKSEATRHWWWGRIDAPEQPRRGKVKKDGNGNGEGGA